MKPQIHFILPLPTTPNPSTPFSFHSWPTTSFNLIHFHTIATTTTTKTQQHRCTKKQKKKTTTTMTTKRTSHWKENLCFVEKKQEKKSSKTTNGRMNANKSERKRHPPHPSTPTYLQHLVSNAIMRLLLEMWRQAVWQNLTIEKLLNEEDGGGGLKMFTRNCWCKNVRREKRKKEEEEIKAGG